MCARMRSIRSVSLSSAAIFFPSAVRRGDTRSRLSGRATWPCFDAKRTAAPASVKQVDARSFVPAHLPLCAVCNVRRRTDRPLCGARAAQPSPDQGVGRGGQAVGGRGGVAHLAGSGADAVGGQRRLFRQCRHRDQARLRHHPARPHAARLRARGRRRPRPSARLCRPQERGTVSRRAAAVPRFARHRRSSRPAARFHPVAHAARPAAHGAGGAGALPSPTRSTPNAGCCGKIPARRCRRRSCSC